ncbi:MAG: AraC family transcriptional regulator [Bacteroidetes bacterium GWC2_33_15]|nr:MAG: AraC family transcriptional regulator [Bacteroidetes bacterium GWA2_33_15]OFX51912.1 MAG: AraC family transcriptional regulator [Bacteroidetes bacterium GWC2_33_15]OFX63480.1 MAG: AraC family transcriptional regulator [Bacteroidetes bacterium GWB2_32_14]OFX67171.1 MAG: AraC family transcriptional regulator [Bacteroidetes bacterium GWD2_33_33]HAN17107.1 AraC family transcriptional regulator [Bacteroidales bacterium]
MNTQTLYIKNMVCPRCIMAVRDIFIRNNIQIVNIKLGEAIIKGSQINFELIKSELQKIGFELLEDKKSQLIDKIKTLIIEYIHHGNNQPLKINFSDYLVSKIGKDYNYITSIFSSVENITIEKYIIKQKIEKVKELIIYDELNLSEIAMNLNYSSIAHLSSQFKNETGLTPTQFKKIQLKNRRNISDI